VIARRRVYAVVAIALLAATAAASAGSFAGAASSPSERIADEHVDRVLIVAVPGLTWQDVADHDLPNLRALLADSGVANMAVRVERLATTPGDGYATLGAGTRSYGPSTEAAESFESNESIGISTALEEYRRRTGVTPSAAEVVVPGIAVIEDRNSSGIFEGTPGRLADALTAAGFDTGVVANADLQPGDTARVVHREAALALMTSDGQVACGSVGEKLLRPDDRGAFGYVYATEAVVAAYEACRTDRSVVLVEASDLRRERAYSALVATSQRNQRWSDALVRTDALVGALLAATDTSDAVVVVAPVSPESQRRLMVLGVHVAGLEPGLLVSASTRQDGYVTLADVAPTIADLVDVEFDVDEIEGRSVTRARTGGTADDRLEWLVDGEAAARFRDRIQAPVVGAFITLASIFSILVALRFVRPGWRAIPKRWLFSFAATILAIPSLTYLVALLPMHDYGGGVYAIVVFGGAAACGAVLGGFHRRWLVPVAVPMVGLLVVVSTSVVLLDSRLQLSTVFGDSPIIAGRFSGINNVTFSQIMVAAILLGAMLVHGLPRARALPAMIALFFVVLAIDVAPMWGADVGGILGGLPALALAAVLLAGWRIRWTTVLLAALGAFAVVIGLGFLDLARDVSDRTHLGRLFERVQSDGISGLSTMVNRKVDQNLRTLTGSIWRYILLPVLASAAMLAWTRPRPLVVLRDRFDPIDRVLMAVAIAGVLGYALNDSGIAIPGTMLAILAPVVGYLLLHIEPGHSQPGHSEPGLAEPGRAEPDSGPTAPSGA
jgi:hypothetical protein